MIHPHTRLQHINDAIGYGVFATAFIPRGTIVYVKDCLELEFTQEEYQQHTREMQQVIEKYSYIDERGVRILSWDLGKYVNHCCQSNTISTGYGFEIAIRDILPGEEITDEYGIFNLEYEMDIQCQQADCRCRIQSSDFDRLYPQWDAQILQVLPQVFDLEQPLLPFMEQRMLELLGEFMRDPSTYRSVYSLKYLPAEPKASPMPGIPLAQ